MAHLPGRKLLALVDGALAPQDRAEGEAHLASCPGCREEHDLLQRGRALLRPVGGEPRPGFAARVALRAAETRPRRALGHALRWALGGGLAAAALAAVVVVRAGMQAAPASEAVRVAQRLDLYEDLAVMQYQQSLEDLEVVERLHTLQPERQP